MFRRKSLEERDAQILGGMLRGSTKWYWRVLIRVFALLLCSFYFYMFVTNAEPDAAWALFGCVGLLGLAIVELFLGFFYPLLREVGRLRKEVERLKEVAEQSWAA